MITQERQEELKSIYFDPQFSGVIEVSQEELQYLNTLGSQATDALANEVFEERMSRLESRMHDLSSELDELRSELNDG